MPTILNTGTTSLTLNTPSTFYTSSSNKHYSAWVNLDNMDTGDTTSLTINIKVLSGDSFTGFYTQVFTDVDGGLDKPVFFIPFFSAPYGVEFILEQTAGTGRDYKWQVIEP